MIGVHTSWYLDKFVWVTISGQVHDTMNNDILWVRNIKFIFYFVQKDKLVFEQQCTLNIEQFIRFLVHNNNDSIIIYIILM